MMDLFTKLVFVAVILQLIESASSVVDFKWKYLSDERLFEIEISTSIKRRVGSSIYVAVAFAPTKAMANADGYACTDKELKSFVIRDEFTDPMILKGLQGAVLKNHADKNGVLSCTFTRRMSVTKTVSDKHSYVFDFNMEQFYVLTATGSLNNGGGLLYHYDQRHITPDRINFASDIVIDDSTCSQEGKNCLTQPEGCSTTDPDCIFFSLKQIGNQFEIELSGGRGNGGQYLAVAFGSTDNMSDADLYYCTGEELKSAVIRRREERPTDLNDTDVTVMRASTIEGVGQCRFFRSACVIKEVTSGIRKKFDFMTDDLYILVAYGDITLDGHLTNHGADHRFTTPGGMKFGSSQSTNYECAQVDFVPETIESYPCGMLKDCVNFPKKCNPSSPDCMFFTFMQSGNSLEIELSGGLGNGQEYMAVGFSTSANMEDVDVYYCDGLTVRSAVIGEMYSSPITLMGTKSVSRAKATTTNGIGHCRFTRPACVNKELSNDKLHAFDLARSGYYIFLARGELTRDGNLVHHYEKVIQERVTPFLELEPSTYECVDDTKIDLSVFQIEDCLLGLKDCVRFPSDCPISRPECAYFSYTQNGGDITMELSGGVGNGKEYVAVGFSETDNFDDAYVYFCNGHDVKSGFRRNGTYQSAIFEGSDVSLNTTTTEGIGRCVFAEAGCVVKNDGKNNKSFNFLETEFYVFLEIGEIDADGKPLLRADSAPFKRQLGINDNNYKHQRCIEHEVTTNVSLPERKVCPSGLKNCDTYPPDCSITEPECASFSYQQSGDNITMKLSGGVGKGEEYIAVAFSMKNNLDNALIYLCNGLETTTGIRRNGVYQKIVVEENVVTQNTTENGIGRCIFTTPGCVLKKYGTNNQTFNFLESDYYVFLEVGKLNEAGEPSLDAKSTLIERRLGKKEHEYHQQKCANARDSSMFIRANYFVICILLLFKFLL